MKKIIFLIGPSASGKSILNACLRKANPEYMHIDDLTVVQEFLQLEGLIARAKDPDILAQKLTEFVGTSYFLPDIAREYLFEIEKAQKTIPKPKFCSPLNGSDMIISEPSTWDEVIIRLAKSLSSDGNYIVEFARGHDPNYLERFKIKGAEVYPRTLDLFLKELPSSLANSCAILHVTASYENRLQWNNKRRELTGQDLPNEVLKRVFEKEIFTADYIDDESVIPRRGTLDLNNQKIPVATINNNQMRSQQDLISFFEENVNKAINFFCE